MMKHKHECLKCHECPKCRDANKTWALIAEEARERERKALAGRDAHKVREFEARGRHKALAGERR